MLFQNICVQKLFHYSSNGKVRRAGSCKIKRSVQDLLCENVLDNEWQLRGFGLTFILMASSSDMHWISSLCHTVSSYDDPQNMDIWQVFNKQFAAGMNWSSDEYSLSSAEQTALLTHLHATKGKREEGKKKYSLGHLLSFQTLIMRDLIFTGDENGAAAYSNALLLQENCS